MSTDSTIEKENPQASLMRITADDYHRMAEIGIFEDKPRVELLDGQIIAMSPLTPIHNSHVDKIATFFITLLLGKAQIRTQGSIRLNNFSEPEPDISLLQLSDDFYNSRQPGPNNTYLIIEVAVNSLSTDQLVKLPKYAAAGIPEYWIVIPEKGLIEVYRQPQEETYRQKNTYQKGDQWLFEPFDLTVKGEDLLV